MYLGKCGEHSNKCNPSTDAIKALSLSKSILVCEIVSKLNDEN